MQLFGVNPPVPPNWVGGFVAPKEAAEALCDFIRWLSALQVVYIQFISEQLPF
jgi:hypothetical protein